MPHGGSENGHVLFKMQQAMVQDEDKGDAVF
jgi:hypothetical protein